MRRNPATVVVLAGRAGDGLRAAEALAAWRADRFELPGAARNQQEARDRVSP